MCAHAAVDEPQQTRIFGDSLAKLLFDLFAQRKGSAAVNHIEAVLHYCTGTRGEEGIGSTVS